MMALPLFLANLRAFVLVLFLSASVLPLVNAQTKHESGRPASPGCHIEAVDFRGWHAQQLSNEWVQLIVVPQNGGR